MSNTLGKAGVLEMKFHPNKLLFDGNFRDKTGAFASLGATTSFAGASRTQPVLAGSQHLSYVNTRKTTMKSISKP